jgi:hypothetical protein
MTLTNRDVAREAVPRAQGNADIAIGDNAKYFAVSFNDRKKSAIVVPHQLRGRPQGSSLVGNNTE